MSADKACQTIMCLGGNPELAFSDLSSCDSDFMYLLSEDSGDLPLFPIIAESAESGLSTESATREALAECFQQKLNDAAAERAYSRSSGSGRASSSTSVSSESLPSRFTVDTDPT